MIRTKNLCRTYEGAGQVAALRDVSFEVDEGDCLAITGPSGCGKSTLLNILGGLDRPDSGEVYAGGVPLHSAGDRELTDYRRNKVGIIFQFFNLLPTMTLEENVELPLLLRGEPAQRSQERAREVLELVGLSKRAQHLPHQVSGGEMQRTAIARALAGSPGLILADEPTGNLDSANAQQVISVLRKIASLGSVSLIIVTHSEELAASLPDHRSMRDGQFCS